MDVLAKPWTGLVFVALEGGPLRFRELRDAVGSIGDRMLSLRLRELEQKRLVRRHVIAGPPVRVAYELTGAGRGFREVSEAVRRWGATIVLARTEGSIGMEAPTVVKRCKARVTPEARPNVPRTRRA